MDRTPKERPILFNGEMVRAILDGRKTQTRRPVTLREFGRSTTAGYDWTFRDRHLRWNDVSEARMMERSPFGKPGGRLWVRERTRVNALVGRACDLRVRYEADGATGVVTRPTRIKPVEIGKCMPNGCFREASRITLEVTSVRVERVQDISGADAFAEGMLGWDGEPSLDGPMDEVGLFSELWDSIYAKPGFGWDANPWVWVCEFRRIDD